MSRPLTASCRHRSTPAARARRWGLLTATIIASLASACGSDDGGSEATSTSGAGAAGGTAQSSGSGGSGGAMPQMYSLTATVQGLHGSLAVTNGAGETLMMDANAPYAFTTMYQTGDDYTVTVSSIPALQGCEVNAGAGTFQEADIDVLIDCHNRLLFGAYDTTHGRELWQSDGTSEGTVLVADIRPGDKDGIPPGWFEPQLPSSPSVARLLDGAALISARGGTVSNYRLWRTDGTAAGTTLVKDSAPAENNFANPSLFVAFGSALFGAAFVQSTGRELVISDGTDAGTQLAVDLAVGALGSDPQVLDVDRNGMYIKAAPGLFRSDGTQAGTQQLPTAELGDAVVRLGDRWVYNTFGETALRATDGTPNGDAELLAAASTDPTVKALVPLGNKVFFHAHSNGDGVELWATDGTPAGTAMYAALAPGTQDGLLSPLHVCHNNLYFSAYDGSVFGLYVTDGSGSAPTLLMSGLQLGDVAQFADRCILLAVNTLGWELYSTDGTQAGTSIIVDLNPNGSGVDKLLGIAGGALLFIGDDGTSGRELYRTDGTAAGTALVKEICPGPCNAL